ncbi:FAD-dependent oxidoreductase [Flavihumibacter sp. CACIAM 22H1]|uniref:FAD-dependent oxidoreductase n=1 Tax=Flavihumibacter sp. CACIAM 22H1 TaxID=1812911 RepID=UPI0007A7D768|nr:FAD-dependent oxidoreductase [Flavihumibacter sp. CACIAM 22H1]KYP14392.1 MAG: xanthan lyase [Flavihumibacter sp. CACIAM 22H1]
MHKLIFLLCCWPILSGGQEPKSVDICIYGGNSAGIIAAYTASKMGKSVIVLEPGKRIGGLSTGGLGYTDIGNKFAVSGLSLDFYRRIGAYYGKFESWLFEPKVALATFESYVKRGGLEIWYEAALVDLTKSAGAIREIQVANPTDLTGKRRTIRAKVFLDCSYEGDLMAKAGVAYTVGREANAQYGETYNGVQVHQYHQFPDGVDPYKIPGDSSSGLLWGISKEKLAPAGSGDNKVQAYNYRICLTNQPDNRIPITEPADYQPERYELLLRYLQKSPAASLRPILKLDLMPNNKTDINNNGPFSTDMIGENYAYPEADYSMRKSIELKHTNYIKGLLYFIGHDRRMPAHLREEMLTWGYPKDEYLESNHWTPQLYVREARRMIGSYVMTQANCQGKELVEDGVGMAAYTMDSHNTQRLVINGMVKNEGDVQIGGFGPYPISYRSLVPKKTDCTNLLVPVCLSASHIAYGSIRMEPVFMVLGQSAAVAATMAINEAKAVQDINVTALQEELKRNPLADGSKPEILLDTDNASQVKAEGSWKKLPYIGFGKDILALKDGAASGRVVYRPLLPGAGSYELYVYLLPRHPGHTRVMNWIIRDGKKTHNLLIDLSSIEVSGQTSGIWHKLGTFELKPGASIRLQGTGEKGLLLADAILLKPLQ